MARAGLTAALEAGLATQYGLRRLLVDHGAEALWAALTGSRPLSGSGAAPARARAVAFDAGSALDSWRAAGGRFVVPGDAEWPTALADLDADAPPGLWLRGGGRLDRLTARCVTVVGARACTPYGEHVAAELGSALGELGWTVVSGAAYGVDAAAHRGALAVGAPSVAVLAGGPDVAYPRAHSGLLARLQADGVLVSEQPPGAKPLRNRFLARNRLLAAIAPATVVVEAAARSGSLVTAGRAAELYRCVLAVPGPVTSALSVGCHQLLRNGALCVTDAADVVDAIGPLDPGLAEPPPADDPVELRVLDVLPRRGGLPTEAVAAQAAVELSQAREVLARLEVDERVALAATGWVVRRPTTPRHVPPG